MPEASGIRAKPGLCSRARQKQPESHPAGADKTVDLRRPNPYVLPSFLMPERESEREKPVPVNPMERLHAYWRMPYILAPGDGDHKANPFADLHKEEDDRRNLILRRGGHCYIVMNRFPYNAGHLLVVPYREVADLEGMELAERHELIDLVTAAQDLLTRALQPDGFNTGFNFGRAAGAGIPSHLHCHVVPRWVGDTNFMPVIGHTRVLPDSLDAMWERLRQFATAE